ncbi:hypothetical protein Salat_1424800 [Sesamum alatum]|uniref:Arabidopsis retrotransposon Orf1 C-terminal domain-containing protein n=1 Tax=Sesamum alatum TaxID=300844 RepID=A0AAE1YAJ1_9LAMI|nr:hypothetical protein Salat_1424800 [Sesamum alatum]
MAPKRARTNGASTSRAQHDTQHGARQPQSDLPYMDLDDRNRYEGLRSRTITNTRYIDNEVLDMLGISDDVEYLFARLGWHDFMFTRWPTYPRLAHRRPHDPGGRGGRREPPAYRPDEFWYELTRQASYDATRSKSSTIINPCFRYLHRVLAHTLFGRGDSAGVVCHSELFVLWGMVNNFQIDTSSFLICQFSKIANSESDAIVLGGFVTPIALHAGLSLLGYEEAQGRNRVNLATCQVMKMITRMGDQYHLLMPDPLPSIPLPDPARLTIQIQDNWWLQEPTTDAEPDDRPAPPPPAPLSCSRVVPWTSARCLNCRSLAKDPRPATTTPRRANGAL